MTLLPLQGESCDSHVTCDVLIGDTLIAPCGSGFVHRCGRTARMGRGGQALLLLQPHEEAYVEFLQLNQQVQLQSMPPRQPCSTDTLVSKVRRMASKDRWVCLVCCVSCSHVGCSCVCPSVCPSVCVHRALYEKGIRAFVSFVQSYSKHECGLLFQVKGGWDQWVGPVGGTSGWDQWVGPVGGTSGCDY